jgi:glycerophosphoryl diester phosphodiesterase
MKPSIERSQMVLADPFRVIAHRGASAYAPENTLAAFELAVELGVHEIETDVKFTKDGKLILFHDDAGSWLKPDTYPDFRWERDYTGEQLITLDELFQRFGDDLTYHIEIKEKSDTIIPVVIECVRRFRLVEHVFIAIIDRESALREAKRLEPGIRTELAPNQQMREMGASQAIAYVAQSGHDIVTLSAWNHSRDLVQLAHQLGIEARSSGIKNREQMIEAVEIGCNGMTINWPDWLLNYIARKET